MSCTTLHEWFGKMKRFTFPFEEQAIPLNGIYVLFQKGEQSHGERIVRIGTHTGTDQLRSRLKQHFMNENKDRSIFRKHIGRCLLAQANDSFLQQWELDLTTREAREKHTIDADKQQRVEKDVTQFIQEHFSFVVFPVEDKVTRLAIESKLISTISHCQECAPSATWLGQHSPNRKIRESGLWQVNELYKESLSPQELNNLKERLFTSSMFVPENYK